MRALVMTDWQEALWRAYPGIEVERVPWTMPQKIPGLLQDVWTGEDTVFLGGCTDIPPEREWDFALRQLESGKELLVPCQGHKWGRIRYHVGLLIMKGSNAVFSMLERWAAFGSTTNLESGIRLCMLLEAATGVPGSSSPTRMRVGVWISGSRSR